jgi:diacylglycerol kinase (ATP)
METAYPSKLLFVINPVSGGHKKTLWEEGIKRYFNHEPDRFRILYLTGKNDDLSIREQINVFQPLKIVAVGGDGTINLVASLIAGTNIALGILPAGSANGLATELEIPTSINEALAVINGGTIRNTDLISINDQDHCIHLSDMGLNALVIKDYSLNRMRGKWGYLRSIFHVIGQRKLIKTTLTINGQTIVRNTYMIVLANARSYGSGALINPDGKMNDGFFEVIVVKELSIWELLKMRLTHKPFNPSKIEVFTTKEVLIQPQKKVYFQIDGEYMGKVDSIHGVIKPAAIQMILPA